MRIRRGHLFFVVAGIGCAVLAFIACYKHATFQTHAFDLGIFVNALWHSVTGNFMFQSVEEVNHFGVHLQLILIAFLPVYFVFASPYVLLLAQPFAIAASIFLIYRIAIDKSIDEVQACCIACLPLFFPNLHFALFFDFHPIMLSMPFVLASILYLERDDYPKAAAFGLAAMACKENVSLIAMAMGLYVVLFRRKYRWGASFVVVGFVWLYVANELILPAMGKKDLFAEHYGHLGNSVGDGIKNIWADPTVLIDALWQERKGRYVIGLLYPLSFVPLLGWRGLLFVLPGLAQNLLTSNPHQFSSRYQYDAFLVPGLMFSFVLGWRKILDWIPKARFLLVIPGVVMLLAFYQVSPISPKKFYYHPLYSEEARTALHRCLDGISRDYSVIADSVFVPHLADRERIHLLNFGRGYTDDLAIVSLMTSHPFRKAAQKRAYLDRLKSKGYEPWAKIDRVFFLARSGVRIEPEMKDRCQPGSG